jgi:methylenetetrahydrofolate reductase (NADPH)
MTTYAIARPQNTLDSSAVRAQKPEPASTLRHLLSEGKTFVKMVELVTSRGPLATAKARKIIALADALAEQGAAHAFSITDNVGGYPKVAPEALGLRLLERGKQVVVHLSTKDLNRNALESRAWTLASIGFENILVISGDHPNQGFRGHAAPVYDVDSVALLELLSDTNRAIGESHAKAKRQTLPIESLYLGAAVSPFKALEAEQVPQYLKLDRKIAAGAEFIITQSGYDSRKWDELLRYVKLKRYSTPILAGVFVLTPGTARYFHAGEVPGIALSDELLAVVNRQAASPDKGKAFFRELAAKQVAVAQGLGFPGAYLSGTLAADDYAEIWRLADSFAGDWRELAREIQFPRPNTFYLFERDPDTGLNSQALDSEYLQSLAPDVRRTSRRGVPLAYKVNRLVHGLAFTEGTPGFKLGQKVYSAVDGETFAAKALHLAEQGAKVPLFRCQDCGDCSLPESAYLCPESQCAKNQRNGPCGGSDGGICEVHDRECMWVRAYNRLKPYGEELRMLDRRPTVRDASLRRTSSWANRFLDRDHASVRSDPPAGKQTEA